MEEVNKNTNASTSSSNQGYPNTRPKNFETEIIAVDEQGRKRAENIIEVYKILTSKPTLEELQKYIRNDYVQHSIVLPDGPEVLAMMFGGTVAQYGTEIDVHRIIVAGDYAFAHVNFRKLNTTAPDDLGLAAVDIYKFGPDGKLAEHWDVLQEVPSHSANPNGMFLTVRND